MFLGCVVHRVANCGIMSHVGHLCVAVQERFSIGSNRGVLQLTGGTITPGTWFPDFPQARRVNHPNPLYDTIVRFARRQITTLS